MNKLKVRIAFGLIGILLGINLAWILDKPVDNGDSRKENSSLVHSEYKSNPPIGLPLIMTPEYLCEEAREMCGICSQENKPWELCYGDCRYLASDFCINYEQTKGYKGVDRFIDELERAKTVTEADSSGNK